MSQDGTTRATEATESTRRRGIRVQELTSIHCAHEYGGAANSDQDDTTTKQDDDEGDSYTRQSREGIKRSCARVTVVPSPARGRNPLAAR
jgi:hypothetical protein